MKRLLKVAVIAAPLLFALNAPACLADAPARQIAFNAMTDAVRGVRSQAHALYSAGLYAQAADQYMSICRSQAAGASDYYWLGESQYHLGAYAEAARAFEYSMRAGSNTDTLYLRLAETYLAQSRFDKLHELCSVGVGLVKDPYVRSQLQSLSKYKGAAEAAARQRAARSPRTARVE